MDRQRCGMSQALRAALLVATLASAIGNAGAAYPIKIFRWDEDYAYLKDRSDLNFPLSLKYVPLWSDGTYASFGGEYRIRVEDCDRPNFGLTHTPNFTALSHRLLAHADLHLDSDVRIFLQLGFSDETGRKPAERSFDKGGFDLAQGFVDWNFRPAGENWRLRLGRQEIAIGRYVTIREGTSIRRTFDGARLDGTVGAWSITAFAARPTLNRRGAFDDEPDPSDFAMAAVASHRMPGLEGVRFDLLVMQRQSKAVRYLPGSGRELRNSLAGRVYGATGNWDFDTQASYQFGHFTPSGKAPLTVRSWGGASETGYTFKNVEFTPRLAVRIDGAQGDNDATDRTLTTFDLPYPNLTYLTDAAIIAPRNVWDIDPFVSIKPLATVVLTTGTQFLWRVSAHDAVYTPIGLPLLPPGTAGAFVAAQPYARLSWNPSPFFELQFAVVLAEPGRAVTSAGGRKQTYFSSSLAMRI